MAHIVIISNWGVSPDEEICEMMMLLLLLLLGRGRGGRSEWAGVRLHKRPPGHVLIGWVASDEARDWPARQRIIL